MGYCLFFRTLLITYVHVISLLYLKLIFCVLPYTRVLRDSWRCHCSLAVCWNDSWDRRHFQYTHFFIPVWMCVSLEAGQSPCLRSYANERTQQPKSKMHIC
jgi:hypothetical protein